MTISIVERGQVPNPEKSCRCNHCNTLFTYQKGDCVRRGEYDPRDQREGPYFTVDCPLCHTTCRAEFTEHDGIKYTPRSIYDTR